MTDDECVGDSPAAGEQFELEGPRGRYAVKRLAGSPLSDDRRCGFLQLT